MGLFNRIKNTIAADLHEVLDEKEKKNPISSLNQYLRQCELEVEKVRKLVERQYRLKDEFTKEFDESKHLAEKRKQQAEIATRAGEEELYQFAYKEQLQYEERAERLKVTLTEATKHLVELETRYEEMKHKLKDMQLKRMELMGRENIARANYRMSQVFESEKGHMNQSSLSFNEMERYLDRLEEQVNSSYYRSTIDARIAHLEKEMKKEESNTLL
ncbi:Phage shock protein A [Litchfieldia salsa]|uniref:Phage shock protein A n=2 Tax=Litchfieldia salsa TaxID=930152 RepID=A0A1H0VVT9_9BACI|nr:PspA/IM30 family protein [Litchfieldia salsa]SDP82667.1 Phage shock protein A [Litchfieldia salsa]